jgi:hypothetical protein
MKLSRWVASLLFCATLGLWQPTREAVVLLNYSMPAEEGALIRVDASETKQLNGRPAYTVAKEPTFEEWQKLHAQ